MYHFSSKGYLTTVAVTPDYFENAIKKDLHGPDSGRDIHHQMLYMEYKGRKRYPPYVDFPVVYRQFDGNKLRDMLDMRFDGRCFLISDRLRSLLTDNGITGWESFPIVLYDKKGNEIPGYNGFTVIGSGGKLLRLPHPKEENEYFVMPEYNIWNYRDWDGSDFFRIKPNYNLLVTQRVKDLLVSNRIESPNFYPIEERIKVIETQ